MRRTLFVAAGVVVFAALPTVGCGGDGLRETIPTSPGDYTVQMTFEGIDRIFGLHLPDSVAPDEPTAVYFVFHGGGPGGNRSKIDSARRWDFDSYADRDGGVIVYPAAGNPAEAGTTWADGRKPTEGVDDIAFVDELLKRLDERLEVDRERVFATGASNGGMFSHRIACELADDVTAVAPVIAALPEKLAATCSPTEPVSMLAIQGTDDPFISYCGGDASHDRTGSGAGGAIYSAAQTRAFWADENACNPEPSVRRLKPRPGTTDPQTTLYRFEYRECRHSTKIDYYVVDGMGHNWPPREALPRLTGGSSDQIDATARIWEFFEAGRTGKERAESISEIPDLGGCNAN